MIEPGTIVSGKFRVERVLGKGGMGVVVVATHVQLGQRVALKFLHDEMAADAGIVERFLREARSAARLSSDHVCRVSDVDRAETGAPYIVMELLDGEDLAQLLARAPLPPSTAADLVLQACVAIAEAHAIGIIHRDLKPSNLFLSKRVARAPIVKVLDFGIAKAPASADFQITRTSMVMGSPGYMSPEQLRSAKSVDARSDIWSLGVILYELVAGKLPFTGDTITELTAKVLMDPPEPLAVDPSYAGIVTRCLEKKPDARYATVTELARDLGACAGSASRYLVDVIAEISGAAPATTASSSYPVASSGSSPIAAAVAVTLAPGPSPVAPAPIVLTPPTLPRPKPVTTLESMAGQEQPKAVAKPASSRRVALVAGGLAVAIAAVVIIAVASNSKGAKKPSSDPAPVLGAAGSAAAIDAAVGQPDVAATIAQVDAAAAVAPVDANDARRAEIEKRCIDLKSAGDWTSLAACANDLEPLAPDEASAFIALAKLEVNAKIYRAKLDAALAGNDLDAARHALDQISATSVIRTAAETAFSTARDQAVTAARAKVEDYLLGEVDCAGLTAYRNTMSREVARVVAIRECGTTPVTSDAKVFDEHCVGPNCSGNGPHEVKVVLAGAGGEFDGLTKEEVDRVVKGRAGIFRACYQKELNQTPGIAGKVVIGFVINADGTVTGASTVAGTTLKNLALVSCLQDNIVRLKFPAKGGAHVSYPFDFSPG